MKQEISKDTTEEEFKENITILINETKEKFENILNNPKKQKGVKKWIVERNLELLNNVTEKGIENLYQHHIEMLKGYGFKDYSLFIIWNFPNKYAI